MRRVSALLCAVPLVLAAALPATAVEKTDKVDVCHYDTTAATYHLISVSTNAVGAHRGHGDALPGEAVPTAAGYIFDADCSLVPVDADGDLVPDASDNCPAVANPDQADRHGSPAGDACEDTDADGTPDVSEADICVSVDGQTILGPNGTATCYTDSPGSEAIANGDGASANARGSNNTATASGDGARANVFSGDNNTARASGRDASAQAYFGNYNSSTATGEHATAAADFGDHSSALATGQGAYAMVQGHNNSATAKGNSAAAGAWIGNNNTATASGDDLFAYALADEGCTYQAHRAVDAQARRLCPGPSSSGSRASTPRMSSTSSPSGRTRTAMGCP